MKIKQNVNEMKINVLPSYLPYGEEDGTEIKIGVITSGSNETSSDIARIRLWRTKDGVYCSPFGELIELTSIKSENEASMVEVTVPVIPKFLFIKGSYWVGGQYEYNTKSKYYEKKSNFYELIHRFNNHFIYYDHEDDIWYICYELIVDYKRLYRSTRKSSTVPSTGWLKIDDEVKHDLDLEGEKYEDTDSDSEDEPSLIIIPGPLTHCQLHITTVREDILDTHPEIFGDYNVTNEWSDGFPVYANKYGKKLVNHYGWEVLAVNDSKTIELELYFSSNSCQAMTKIMYEYDGELKLDGISIFCSNHGTKL